MTIGDRIKALRTNKGLTQSELAKLLGVEIAAISKYETNRVIPSEATIKLLCATYHVSYRWLTEGIEPMFEAGTGDALIDRYAPDADEHLKAAIRTMSELSDDEWRSLRDYMAYLLQAVDRIRADHMDEK